MRNTRPVFAFILIVSVQSLCAQPRQGGPTAAPVTPAAVTLAPGTATSPSEATETPGAESVGTINLVTSQVETGPLENLQFLEGLQDFHNGDAVRVTGGGKGELTLDDGTQLTLYNDTKVDRVDVTVSPNETRLRLVDQGLDGFVPPGETFIAEMPNGAVFTILGTRFIILYNTDTQTATAGNFDGSVLYTPPGGTEQELPAGRMVNIPAQGGVEMMVLPFTPEEFEGAVDSAGTPTAGLTTLIEQHQIEPIVFSGQEVGRTTHAIVSSAAFSPDGNYVVSGGSDGMARLWALKTSSEVAHMDHGSGSVVVEFSPDGKYVVSGTAPIFGPAGRVPGGGFVREASPGGEIAGVTHQAPVKDVSFTAGAKYTLSGSSEASSIQTDSDLIVVWEAATGNPIARTSAGGGVGSLVFSPDGGHVVARINNFTAESASGTVLVWETATGREIRMSHDPVVQDVSFSPDGNYVVSANTFGTILVWDAFSGREVAHMTPDSTLHSVAFSPDGRYVLSISEDGTARVWLWQSE